MTWRQTINRIRAEADEVLHDAKKYNAKGRIKNCAELIVAGIAELEKEITRGRVEHALNRLTGIYSHYEDMFILKHAPQYNDKLFTTSQFIKTLNAQSNAGKKSAATRNIEKEKNKQRWQQAVDEIYQKKPRLSLTDIRTKAGEKAGVSRRTLEINKIIPAGYKKSAK